MAGTKIGGQKIRDANLAKDPDYYKKLGQKGGKLGRTGGFHNNPELARRAGAIGGKRSRRPKNEVKWIKVPDLDASFDVNVPFPGEVDLRGVKGEDGPKGTKGEYLTVPKHLLRELEALNPALKTKKPSLLKRLFPWVKG